MPIAVLVLALALYLYLLAQAPWRIRVAGLAAGAIVSLALGLWLLTSEPEAAREAQRIAPSELTLDQLTLERVGRGATLSGRVLNGSPAFRLREMTLVLRLRDCPAEAEDPAACPVIGEGQAIARPDAPPGQIRGFSAHFSFPNLPPAAGELRWDWTIVATRATE